MLRLKAIAGTITIGYWRFGAPGGDALLNSDYAGCYLFATDERFGHDAVMTSHWQPVESVTPRTPAQTVALSAPAGPAVPGGECALLPPSWPRAASPPVGNSPKKTPVAKPSAVIRRRAQQANGRLILARVRCAAACRVRLSVSDGRRTVRRSRTAHGSQALALLRRGGLRAGTLRVRVDVDGELLAAGRTRLGR